MRKVILTILLPIFVLACDKDGNLGREESPAWHKRVSTKQKMEYFTPKCMDYGYKKGTPELRECVIKEIRQSEANANARMSRPQSPARISTTCVKTFNTIQCF